MIYDPRGQWAHPGENTRIPGEDITMRGVPYLVWAVPNLGAPMMMMPEQEYNFPGADYVDEFPMASSGISISPSKRGTFTRAAKSRHMGVQEFAAKVLANKDQYSPAMVKKANFARNAAKWHHQNGGDIQTGGGYNIQELMSLEDGGFIDAQLTDEEINKLKSLGFRIEEL